MQRAVADTDNRASERDQEQIRRNQAIIDLLQAWEHEDPQEQRETLEFLMRALDEDRTSARKRFL